MDAGKKVIDIVGSQMDLGASRKGVDMGPSAIRHADLLQKIEHIGLQAEDRGDIVPAVAKEPGDPRLRYAREINEANERLCGEVRKSLESGHFPLILGGDHSIAAGSIPAVAEHYGSIGVIWVDAHGDFNDESITPTGNMHGMPLSAVAGLGPDCMVSFSQGRVDPRRIVIIGARDLDPLEVIKLRENGVTVYSISEVHKRGIAEIAKESAALVSEGTEGVHLSFDMDALEPAEAPGVGTPVMNGLTLREAFMTIEIIRQNARLLSMDLVETNPLLDTQNKTGILATDLIITALGGTEY